MRAMIAQRGISIVEILIAVLIASLVLLAGSTVYTHQSALFVNQNKRSIAAEDGRAALDLIYYLIQHADLDSVEIDNVSGAPYHHNDPDELEKNNDSIEIEFSLPEGLPIWPNDTSPFDETDARISWTNTGSDPFGIYLVTKRPSDSWPSNKILLAGGNTDSSTRVINLDLFPLKKDGTHQSSHKKDAEGGYELVVTTRAGSNLREKAMVRSLQTTVLPRNN